MDDQSVSRSILNIRNLAILVVFSLMIWFIVLTRQVFGIFLFSMVLAFLLYPLVDRFHKNRVPRSIAILIVYLLLLLVLGLIGLLIVPSFINQFNNLIIYIIGQGEGSLIDRLNIWATKFETSFNERFNSNIQIDDLIKQNQEKIQTMLYNLVNYTWVWVGNVASLITIMVSIPVITFYLLMDWPKIKISLLRFLPPKVEKSTSSLMDSLNIKLNSYLRGQLKLSLMMAIITSSSLALLNAIGYAIPSYGFHIGPYLILGLLAGITEVIPIVGPIIAFTPALILGFMNGSATGITVVLLYALIQFFEGNILVPRIMGKNLDVHPLTVMFALLCGGILGGIGGMLLALPFAAGLKVLFEQYYPNFIESLENLFSDQQQKSKS